MKDIVIIIILLIVIIIILYLYKQYQNGKISESFGSGVLVQLHAQGPEDVYLTRGIRKYIPEYVYGLYPFRYYLWGLPQVIPKYFGYYYPQFYNY